MFFCPLVWTSTHMMQKIFIDDGLTKCYETVTISNYSLNRVTLYERGGSVYRPSVSRCTGVYV